MSEIGHRLRTRAYSIARSNEGMTLNHIDEALLRYAAYVLRECSKTARVPNDFLEALADELEGR